MLSLTNLHLTIILNIFIPRRQRLCEIVSDRQARAGWGRQERDEVRRWQHARPFDRRKFWKRHAASSDRRSLRNVGIVVVGGVVFETKTRFLIFEKRWLLFRRHVVRRWVVFVQRGFGFVLRQSRGWNFALFFPKRTFHHLMINLSINCNIKTLNYMPMWHITLI